MDLKEKIGIIENLIKISKFSLAIEKCKKLLKKYPKVSFIYNLCGLAYQMNKNIHKSIECFELALHYEPENIAAFNNLANSYKFLHQSEKSEQIYEKILKKEPNNVKILNNYANLKKKLNDFEGAKTLLLKAEQIEKNNIDLLHNIAECHQSIGDYSSAKLYANKILSLKPNDTAAHRFLSGLTKYNNTDTNNLNEIQNLEKDNNFNNFSIREKKDVFFALGKAYEDLKNYEQSFKYLEKGNSIVRKELNYNIFNQEKFFNRIIKLFKDFDFDKVNKRPLDKKIIFIVGMPRSGTTLVEQIIASHPDVNGAGELIYLNHLIEKNFMNDNSFDNQKIMEQSFVERSFFGEQYLEHLSYHKLKTNIITDKAPQNFVWLGFIKIFFPNSLIIHCRRNAKDCCFSIFKNYFPSNEMLWSFTQKEIAEYYNLYLKLMEFWNTKIGFSLFNVDYEKIISDPENEIKKIISHCNLNWDSSCLNFYKNRKTPITTASVNQAREPIYNTSINSYEPYSKYLEQMFNILDTNIKK